MTDSIDRQGAIDAVNKYYNDHKYISKSRTILSTICTDMKNVIDNLPSTKSKGKWIEIHTYPDTLQGHTYGTCSNCLKVRIVDNFCPNCGADMREVEE